MGLLTCHPWSELHYEMHFVMGKCNSDHVTWSLQYADWHIHVSLRRLPSSWLRLPTNLIVCPQHRLVDTRVKAWMDSSRQTPESHYFWEDLISSLKGSGQWSTACLVRDSLHYTDHQLTIAVDSHRKIIVQSGKDYFDEESANGI